MSFCRGVGCKWPYQESTFINQIIAQGLKKQYKESYFDNGDKSTRPIFMICNGAGTGKSRLLDEFHTLAIKVTADSECLHERVKSAYVFQVDFENGTSSGTFNSADKYLTSRMYYQVADPPCSWSDMSALNFQHMNITKLIEELAAAENKKVEDLSIIILVDGLQKLPHESKSKSSVLYQVLSVLGDLSNTSGTSGGRKNPFTIVCVAATIQEPMSEWIGDTRQCYCLLTPHKLDGLNILEPRDCVEELMVEDMGGHGCSLEILSQLLVEYREDKKSSTTVMQEVVQKLCAIYPKWSLVEDSNIIVLLQYIMVGKEFENLQQTVGSKTIDHYQQLGLVSWNSKSKRLECPFVWLRIVAKTTNCLQDILDPDSRYRAAEFANNPNEYPLGKVWQHWEEFVARFWCLKTVVYAGKESDWEKHVHAGALFKDGAKHMVTIKQLELVTAKHKCETSSAKLQSVITINGKNVNPRDGNHHILSAPGNSGADSFCCLKVSGVDCTYSISCKKEVRNRSLSKYKTEFEKAAGKDDFFIEFATGAYPNFNPSDFPTDRCGLVCANNYREYFGPFAGRAFFLMNHNELNINTAPRNHLLLVTGIGEKTADEILAKRPFETQDKAMKSIKGFGPKKAKLFKYTYT